MKNLVTRFYAEVLNAGRDEVLEEILTPDFRVHPGPAEVRGPAAVRANIDALRAAFDGLHFEVDDAVGEGDRVAARWTMRGTHTGEFYGQAPSGREIEQVGMVFYRVADGRLAELWILIDAYGLFQQIAA